MYLRIVVCFSVMLSAVISGPIASENSSHNFTFYNRTAWDALPAAGSKPLVTPVPYVVIHHTYIPGACFSKDTCSASMRSMQNYHRSLSWGDIGYNFCVGTDGAVYEGRGWLTLGIHSGNANRHSVGICLIGDWRETLPPPEVLSATKALISSGVQQGLVRADYKLIGHRQAMATECPGAALFTEISSWEHFTEAGFNKH